MGELHRWSDEDEARAHASEVEASAAGLRSKSASSPGREQNESNTGPKGEGRHETPPWVIFPVECLWCGSVDCRC